MMNKRLTTALIISSSIFAISILTFIWGCDLVYRAPKSSIGIIIVAVSFTASWISTIARTKYKKEIETVLEYGLPIHKVNQEIVDIINQSTGHGVKQLHGLLKKSINDQIKKAIEEGTPDEPNDDR